MYWCVPYFQMIPIYAIFARYSWMYGCWHFVFTHINNNNNNNHNNNNNNNNYNKNMSARKRAKTKQVNKRTSKWSEYRVSMALLHFFSSNSLVYRYLLSISVNMTFVLGGNNCMKRQKDWLWKQLQIRKWEFHKCKSHFNSTSWIIWLQRFYFIDSKAHCF